ncbi:MAG: glycosyltransferase [Verrucomicrobiae bacterium]|nr:glycosyltransferase [Verrucomicrobiae bacterium]
MTGDAASSKVDLHVHSRHSDRPSEWILRRVGAPECFTAPEGVYAKARAAGMDFVTITDHNEIAGALELRDKHPDDVFVSEEITAYFPDNGCKMHILAWDVTEDQHREIRVIRENIYELAAYLREKGILHAVAHPFYQNNEKLTIDQFEKLILMFKHFEGINGARDDLMSRLAVEILRGLNEETIANLADRHGMTPSVPEPHVKFLTGGSDDHSSVFIARAWTETAKAGGWRDFLDSVREGRTTLAGRTGSPFTMSHSLLNIAYLYYSDKLSRGSRSGHELMVKVFENFVKGRNPTKLTWGQRLRHGARRLTRKRKTAAEREFSVSSQLGALLRQDGVRMELAGQAASGEEVEIRSFRMASRLVNELTYTFLRKLLQRFAEGNIMDCLQAVSALGPIALGAAPYLVAFSHHTKDRGLMLEASRRFLGRLPPEWEKRKRAWFTDTLQDINGVSHTIHKICEVARRLDREICVIACKSKLEPTDLQLKNFPPAGEFALPEYEELQVAFPPFLDMVEYCWRERFTEIVISTPGPVGLAGLAAGKLLGLPVSGIYHTDFPQYVKVLTGDETMGEITWKYMEWFYGALDWIYVPSHAYYTLLLDRGFPSEKLKIMPRGIDCEVFSPAKREASYWEMFRAKGRVTFIYAGRVSREKDLDVLAEAYEQLWKERQDVLLAVVGEGPYAVELKKRLPRESAVFTGFLSGEALCRAYASSDVFVFPSTTDTFGNVVLEAMASGLPAIVSDQGGPRESVKEGVTGMITRARDAQSLLSAMRQCAGDASLRSRMSEAARAHMSEKSWERAFHDFWVMGE